MADVLRIAQYYSYLLDWRQFLVTLFFVMLSILVGVLLYALCQPFVSVRQRWGRLLLILTMGLGSAMVIWVGDPNLLYTFPVFVIFFMLATSGNRLGRLAMCFIFFCLIMSISALLDTYLGDRFISRSADYIVSLGRPLLVGIIYLCYRRFLPKQPVQLSRNLWALVFALSLMPLCALAATVLLTYPYNYESVLIQEMILRLGIAILPFVLVTSLVLLAAVIVLARQEALEQEHALATQRNMYYEGLRQQDQQLRQLRHDLRNHITAASGLLELGKLDEARAYLDALGDSKALSRPRRFCDNDTANVVLAPKPTPSSEQASPVISRLCCQHRSLWPTPTSAPSWATPSTMPARAPAAVPTPRCGCAAASTKACSCSPSTIPLPARCIPTCARPRPIRTPTVTGCQACAASLRATAAVWKHASTTPGFICWSASRREAARKHQQSNPFSPTALCCRRLLFADVCPLMIY